MKRIFLVLVVVSFSLLIEIQSAMAENVGNKVCPVTDRWRNLPREK